MLKMGWKKRGVNKIHQKKGKRIKRSSQKKNRSWRGEGAECTYLMTWSSLFQRPMPRDYHWRHQPWQTLHHNIPHKEWNKISTGTTGERGRKIEGKKKNDLGGNSVRVYILAPMSFTLLTSHAAISPLKSLAWSNTKKKRKTNPPQTTTKKVHHNTKKQNVWELWSDETRVVVYSKDKTAEGLATERRNRIHTYCHAY